MSFFNIFTVKNKVKKVNSEQKNKIEINRDLEEIGNTKLSPKSHLQGLQLKKWFFTFNNYTEADILLIKQRFRDLNCEKYFFQEETGKEGTPHLQGCVFLFKKCRWSEFKLPKNIHWEKLRNEDASMNYCLKEESRTGRQFIYPEDIETIKKENFYDWQNDIMSIINVKPDSRSIYWFWEENGHVGKSAMCKYLVKNNNALFIDEGKKADLINLVFNNNMNNCNLVVVDIPRDNGNSCSYKTLESIKNGLVCNTKYETGTKLFNPPHILVFCNSPPETEKLSKDRWNIYNINENKRLIYNPVLPDEA